LIPAYEFQKYSNHDAKQTYDNYNGTFSMTPQSTYEFLFPSLGLPPDQTMESANQVITDQVNIGNDYLGAFGYLGVWVPFLFCMAFKRKEKKFMVFLASLALLAVLTAWGRWVPLHRLFCAVLPGINLSRAPFRFLQAYVLIGCVLLAYGYQMLERQFQAKGKSTSLAIASGAYAILFLIIGILRPDRTWPEIFALILGASGLMLWSLTESWKKIGSWFFQTALILPLLFTGWGGFSLGPSSNFDLEDHFPTFTYLKAHSKGTRYYFDQSLKYPLRNNGRDYMDLFPQDSPMALGIRDCGGYNVIFLKKVTQLKKLPIRTYLNLLSVQSLFFGKDAGEVPGFNRRPFGSIFLYEPISPPNYVNTPYQFQMIPDDNKDLQVLSDPGFDPANQVVLNDSLSPSIVAQLPGHKATIHYEIARDDPDYQVFKLGLDRNSLVTFSEVVYPGWQAFLDGNQTDLLTANHVFRALFIPAGEHQVEFRFAPAWFKPLLIFLAVWCLSALLFGIYLWLRRKSLVLEPPQTP
jgi:hypothetical protein